MINVTTMNTAALDLDKVTNFPTQPNCPQPTQSELSAANLDAELSHRIMACRHGESLLKYCREFARNLVRSCLVDEPGDDLRETLSGGVRETLRCTDHQAQCVVDLSLELMHIKAHGSFFTSNVDLGYLINSGIDAISAYLRRPYTA